MNSSSGCASCGGEVKFWHILGLALYGRGRNPRKAKPRNIPTSLRTLGINRFTSPPLQGQKDLNPEIEWTSCRYLPATTVVLRKFGISAEWPYSWHAVHAIIWGSLGANSGHRQRLRSVHWELDNATSPLSESIPGHATISTTSQLIPLVLEYQEIAFGQEAI